MKKIEILGFPIDSLTKEELLPLLEAIVSKGEKAQLCTIYSSLLVWAQKDIVFAQVLKNSHLNLPDGAGLLAAADFLAHQQIIKFPIFRELELIVRGIATGIALLTNKNMVIIPKRLSGVDIVMLLLQTYLPRGWRFFFLGGYGSVSQELKKKILHKFRPLDYSGQIEESPGPSQVETMTLEQNAQLVKKINDFGPQVLLVALGPIKQEKWIAANLAQLKVNMAMGVGGSFDLLTGKVKRAPFFLQKMGLEWLWRVVLEKRNLNKAWAAFPIFPILIAKEKLRMIKSS